ncbi:aminopeptidase P family protein [Lichenifustis flavocetrariae]|uniref:Aminopeptidase P family protein n=1 Tax=Lichenifustis flavocetrariae TaxID=2949735 RepID=A0AA41YUY1_9HYPH|nr:aminopeptidase P family protein [Lichenifustis flavocetrariae]MCW6507363.1 aminopeptidase P family protein [Lichenifustis flavocetrariae]
MFESVFQTFTEVADPSLGPARLATLRQELERRGLDGFLVPRADEHQNEYVPKGAERLAWLTGFTGSAGVVIVLARQAAIFVDGRYTVQVREQVDTSAFTPESLIDTPPERWLEENLKAGQKLGYDPWLHTPGQVDRMAQACKAAEAELVAVDDNPIDAIWPDRPAAPLGAVSLHRKRLAGQKTEAKLAAIRKALKGCHGLVVTDPHAIAWLFNIRGSDVPHTPLPLGYAIVPREGRPTLYLDGRKLSNSVRNKLEDVVTIEEPGQLAKDLATFGTHGATLRFDAATAPAKLKMVLTEAGGKPDVGLDPIALLKAAKNETEREGSRAAHLRDAVAMVRFLHWFDKMAPTGKLTEISTVEALESFRRETLALKDVSFPTIAGFGRHAAIPHYRVTTESNLAIGKGIFLIDSGAQYEDGTTDITRTVVVGRPTAEMKDRFTRVLKGHIAIARAVFPVGVSGAQLDSFARQFLWAAGLDFDHGTGHGIGSYLSVHEGPQRIAKTGTTPLVEGMILSNEPGYYKAGAWGIRIENLLIVEKREIKGAERPMLGFETVSFAPIDLNLVEPALMTAEEIAWLDSYHAVVRRIVSPLVEPIVRRWLAQATRKLVPPPPAGNPKDSMPAPA